MPHLCNEIHWAHSYLGSLWFSACKEIPRILCTFKVNCHMHMTSPLVPVLSQMIGVCTLPFCLFKSHFIFCHILLILKRSFCFKFPQQNPVDIYFLFHAWYMLCLSHLLAWKNRIFSLIITEGSEINVFLIWGFPLFGLTAWYRYYWVKCTDWGRWSCWASSWIWVPGLWTWHCLLAYFHMCWSYYRALQGSLGHSLFSSGPKFWL